MPYRVHLQGFSDFERSALGSYFRLAANRSPTYEQVDSAAEAHFLIVDADHAAAVRGVVALGRTGTAVFIGAQPPDGAAAWAMRPIDPLHVLRELDSLVATMAAQRTAPAAARSAEPASKVRTVILPPRPRAVPSRRAGDGPVARGAGFVPLTEPAAAAKPAPADALLIDTSELVLRQWESKLHAYGLGTERATTSARALELLERRDFDLVLLDVELDGLALCQRIKRRQRFGAGRRPPVVTLVADHHSEIDRVRGSLAGADAYLGKPLDDEALRQMLVDNGFVPPPATPEAATPRV